MKSRTGLIQDLRDLFPMAIEKVLAHRCTSVSTMLGRIANVLLELDDEPVRIAFETAPYHPCGAPKLGVLARAYCLDLPPDPEWVRMSRGEPCEPGCCRGCQDAMG